MKNLSILAAVLVSTSALAQVPPFTRITAPYQPLTSATVLSIANTDEGTAAITLPFGFPFNGATYQTVYAHVNGQLLLTLPTACQPFTGSCTTYTSITGIPSAPAGWVQDANFSTLFDWIELTWELNASDTTLGANTTQVDMFGLPFNLSLAGSDAEGKPLTVQGGFSDAGLRHQILTALQNAPAPWQQLVLTEAQSGLATRAIAPYHGMEMGLFPRTQLDDCIAQVWAKYTTETLTATAEGVTFNGQVVADQLVFTPAAGTGETITFPKPDSFMVYTSGPLPLVDTTKAGVLKAALQAGFLRSTLLISTQLPECDASRYYQAEPVNQYARTFHEYGTNGGAYAFGFDDVCSHSSFIIVHNPQSAQLTLLAF
mgnify:CR=1 FL=1